MAQFGVSATHLLKQRLLEELKNELLFSNLNVSQLADEFHFSDPSHLMRFFQAADRKKTFTRYMRDYEKEFMNKKRERALFLLDSFHSTVNSSNGNAIKIEILLILLQPIF